MYRIILCILFLIRILWRLTGFRPTLSFEKIDFITKIGFLYIFYFPILCALLLNSNRFLQIRLFVKTYCRRRITGVQQDNIVQHVTCLVFNLNTWTLQRVQFISIRKRLFNQRQYYSIYVRTTESCTMSITSIRTVKDHLC